MSGPRDDGQAWDSSRVEGGGYAGPPPSQPAPPASPAGQPYPAPPGAWGAPPPYPAAPQPWGAQQGWWTPPPPPPAAWPKGPGRPQQASAAAVLAFIAGGIGMLWGLVGIVLLAGSDGGTGTWLGVVVGLPAGVAAVVGGVRLLAGADRWFVVGAGAALGLAVLLQAVVSAANSYGSAFGQALLVVFLLPPPVVAAVLAGLPVVGGWVEHVRGTTGAPLAQPTPPAPPTW
ncbi:MAG: hypothetical protein F2825_01565 [Actinobacteria bacterium]|nr:hypothetical protein [Actinomycetota bacterium]